ncbi:MAG TPA: neutral zinc metallopeptidase, partial [Thermomicrobiaceae bacterium]|nr:neutral zinc metallopeptidase [Thermomicrobiaceae bacterium]
IVLYHGAAGSACGPARPDNAMYCAADGGIYVSADLFRELVVVRHEDFAAGVVLAHEWGHAIQDQTGVLRWALRHRYLEGVELQADCYAGLFSRSAQTAGILDPGDLREAETEMASIGDRVKLSRTTPGAHGTAKQRLAWFMRGYRAAGMGGCAAVYAALYPKKH